MSSVLLKCEMFFRCIKTIVYWLEGVGQLRNIFLQLDENEFKVQKTIIISDANERYRSIGDKSFAEKNYRFEIVYKRTFIQYLLRTTTRTRDNKLITSSLQVIMTCYNILSVMLKTVGNKNQWPTSEYDIRNYNALNLHWPILYLNF